MSDVARLAQLEAMAQAVVARGYVRRFGFMSTIRCAQCNEWTYSRDCARTHALEDGEEIPHKGGCPVGIAEGVLKARTKNEEFS